MKNTARWLLPEGIEESLPAETARIERLRRVLLDLYRSWGYEQVMTPLIEYLDSLLIGAGGELDLETFKITDQLNGRLMGVRADLTPQVARIDAHRLGRDVPTRLCYLARVLRTRPQGPGGTRSPLQVGAELYGHRGVDSDVEIIRLMLATLEICGIVRVHVDLGHLDIFGQLVARARLCDEEEAALFDMLQRKAVPEIETLLAAHDLPAEQRAWFLALAELNGDVEVLDAARSQLSSAGPAVIEALDYLAETGAAIRRAEPDVELRFDLAELRGYRYHSGIVYAAYVPGHGTEIARGGRYDGIGAPFGRARPATGFSADLESLMLVGHAQEPASPPSIYAPAVGDASLERRVAELRAQGRVVVRELRGQSTDAHALGCREQLVSREGQWVITEAV
ncbi:ATP phosphoribosyltransferase regulatory subunit [Acidihalobacter ferrooxydans]|uniref:ATP phosphoribosyltransferase regulatory subunit n=1 Tax=Acidihalobacter ferrooxydans TaxID=1765967 RepID=A0A1P8UIF2_9GAMM|nr:ATP phosphoribosyltransferase regulatory subunit [Acidihalobacter ferrooxydans]APZ43541.1 ATP phosphoribosyltransferase regulatory subunit [Acidihalobacter ferrooxydans]